MKKILYQVQDDLIRLRTMIPLNGSQAKAIIKRIDWAIIAIQKKEHALDARGELDL